MSEFFAAGQGAFGCEADARPELVELARRRAGGWPAERTVLVGDTPRDVAGAHEAGALAIAVTSGAFDALSLAHADAVIETFADLPAALERL